ncbi:MAG: C13 family peptidase, partial [Pseudomonadota bacterium]
DFSLNQNGLRLPDLHAIELAQMLEPLGLKYQVLIVSACFSGGFIPYLDNENTTVITASRRDRTSFGCADENDMTDFGRALLVDNLGKADTLGDAFNVAVERITESEAEQGITPASEPQMNSAEAVNAQFRRWREQSSTMTAIRQD